MRQESRVFADFREASGFARALASRKSSHTLARQGESWVVSFSADDTGGATRDAGETTRGDDALEIQQRKLAMVEAQLAHAEVALRDSSEQAATLEVRLAEQASKTNQLQQELAELRENIEREVLARLAHELAHERAALQQQREECKQTTEDASNKRTIYEARAERFDLLQRAYSERFGAAEVRRVAREHQSKSVCPRCGGDGGVRGGCARCDGTGWLTEVETQFKDVVEFARPKNGSK